MATTEDHANGQAPAEIRVAFDDRPGRTMPLEWAEAMLRLMYAEHRATFAEVLSAAVLEVKMRPPVRHRSRS